jgi:hypothetical protein
LREAAKRAGFSARTAARIERNDGRVRIDKHLRYGEALGVPFRFELARRRAEDE